jgi:hypothetical protein
LFVTGAFDFTDTGFATVLDAFVVVAVALETTFLLTGLLTDGDVLEEAAVFLTGDFGVGEEALGLAAAGFVFLTGDVRGFAGLFIAFAMESNTNLVTLICAMGAAACTLSVVEKLKSLTESSAHRFLLLSSLPSYPSKSIWCYYQSNAKIALNLASSKALNLKPLIIAYGGAILQCKRPCDAAGFSRFGAMCLYFKHFLAQIHFRFSLAAQLFLLLHQFPVAIAGLFRAQSGRCQLIKFILQYLHFSLANRTRQF